MLAFALAGTLRPLLDGGGQALRLQDGLGKTVLVYDALAVHDARGRDVPGHVELTADTGQDGVSALRVVVRDAAAVYPLTGELLLHAELRILRASDGQAEDYFGWSVAISGDTAVVGAYGEDGGAGDPAAYAAPAYALLFGRHVVYIPLVSSS